MAVLDHAAEMEGRRPSASLPVTAFPQEQMTLREDRRLPILARLMLISILMPLFFSLGDLLLTPTRLLCLVMIPYLTVRLLSGAYGRLVITDYLIFFYSFWVMLSFIKLHGGAQIPYAGSQVAITLGGYLVARASIRSPGQMIAMSGFMVTLVLILMPFAFIEALTGEYIIPQWIVDTGLFGTVGSVPYPPRMGLYRAQVVFAHPIHWGLYCSMALSLYFVTRLQLVGPFTRYLVSALIVLGTFFSVSSGPFLTVLFQLALIFYMLVLNNVKMQWKLLVWGGVIGYTAIELSTTKFGMFAIAQKLAFNSHTAYYRPLIWQYGTAQVDRTPFFGVGRGGWSRPFWMTSSIDNYWLQLAVVNGLPASISMFGAFMVTMIFAGRGHYVKGSDAYYVRVGYTFTFVALILSLATVTVWNEVLCMLMFLLGAGQYMLQATAPSTAPAAEARDDSRPTDQGPAYSRFPPRPRAAGPVPGLASAGPAPASMSRTRTPRVTSRSAGR